jgi:hypothetical protein
MGPMMVTALAAPPQKTTITLAASDGTDFWVNPSSFITRMTALEVELYASDIAREIDDQAANGYRHFVKVGKF